MGSYDNLYTNTQLLPVSTLLFEQHPATQRSCSTSATHSLETMQQAPTQGSLARWTTQSPTTERLTDLNRQLLISLLMCLWLRHRLLNVARSRTYLITSPEPTLCCKCTWSAALSLLPWWTLNWPTPHIAAYTFTLFLQNVTASDFNSAASMVLPCSQDSFLALRRAPQTGKDMLTIQEFLSTDAVHTSHKPRRPIRRLHRHTHALAAPQSLSPCNFADVDAWRPGRLRVQRRLTSILA